MSFFQRHQQPPPQVIVFAKHIENFIESLVSPDPCPSPTGFAVSKPPKLSLKSYIIRIAQYCPTSKVAWIVAALYFYRVAVNCGQDFIHVGSIHRLLLLCVVLSSKFCDDRFKTNSYYARVGGVPVKELNVLEVELLQRLDYRLHVTHGEYRAFQKHFFSIKPQTKENLDGTTKSPFPRIELDGFLLLPPFARSNSESDCKPDGGRLSPLRQLAALLAI